MRLRSRIAGIGFVALTILLLILALYTGFVVFEVDGIFSFLAAIILLLSDTHRRVQTRVVDVLVGTAEEMTSQLLGKVSGGVRFVYWGKTVPSISLVESGMDPRIQTGIIPPGRGLASLFLRETGLREVSMDSLASDLPRVMTESFALAGSLSIKTEGDTVEFLLRQPSFSSICGGPPSVGSPVASFLAILVCAAQRKAVEVKSCTRDEAADAATIILKILPVPERTA